MRAIPLGAKLLYSAFVAILVPYYWVTYTPWNFLYFCDVALLMTLAGMWTENALLISMQAVAILLPQTLWVTDLLARLILGVHLTGMTAYMFDPNIPVFVRAPPPAPSAHPSWAVNINYVWGLGDAHPQTMMPPAAWLMLLCTVAVAGFYAPTHSVLARAVRSSDRSSEGTNVRR